MRTIRILLVEDDRVYQEYLKEVFSKHGYETAAVFESGEEAYKYTTEIKPDIILMDIILTGEWDGIETSKRILKTYQVPIVYITGDATLAKVERATIETQPYGYLHKPIEEHVLYTTIETVISRFEAETALQQKTLELQNRARQLEVALAKSKKQENQINTLLKASKYIFAHHTFEKQPYSLFKECMNLIGASFGLLLLFQDDSTTMRIIFSEPTLHLPEHDGSSDGSASKNDCIPLGEMETIAITTQKPTFNNMICPDVYQQLFQHEFESITNVLMAPLLDATETVGLFVFGEKPDGFSYTDGKFATTFSELVSIAYTQDRNRKQLEQSERRYWELFNNMPSGVMVFDTDRSGRKFYLRDMNKAGQRIDDNISGEIIGQEIRSILPFADEKGITKVFERVFHTSVPEHIPSFQIELDDQSYWREVFIYKLPSNEMVLIYNDVTTQVLAELELRSSFVKLERMNQEMLKNNDELQHRILSETILSELGNMLMAPHFNLEEIAEIILYRARFVTNCTYGFVSIVDQRSADSIDFTFTNIMDQSTSEQPAAIIRQVEGTMFGGLWKYVLHNREAFFTNNTIEHAAFKKVSLNQKIQNFLSVSAISGDTLYGQIGLANQPEGFSERDLSVVKQISHLFAMIIQRKFIEENLKQALSEKEVLLREVHHRVKNNLNVIVGLLTTQEFYASNPEVRANLHVSRNRVYTLALIHEMLYKSENLAEVNFQEYIEHLLEYLKTIFDGQIGKVHVDLQMDNISMNVNKSVPCGILINEILTNSFKHAFPNNRNGKIFIKMRALEHQYLITIGDDGPGISSNQDLFALNTLGMELISNLPKQFNGAITYTNNHGLAYEITIPKE